jgi:hypothetical protein
VSARTITFYDSTNLADLPRRARRIFTYIDGPEENTRAARARWPRRLIVPITIGDAGPHALEAPIIDSEAGDADPRRTAQWCQAKLHARMVPTVYRSAALWAPVTAELERLGLHYGIGAGSVQRFSADYDGNPTIAPGDVAHQYLGSPNGGSPGHYDVTAALPYVPGWGMGAPLSRRHARYVRTLNGAWGQRTRELTGPDRAAVEILGRRGAHLLELP